MAQCFSRLNAYRQLRNVRKDTCFGETRRSFIILRCPRRGVESWEWRTLLVFCIYRETSQADRRVALRRAGINANEKKNSDCDRRPDRVRRGVHAICASHRTFGRPLGVSGPAVRNPCVSSPDAGVLFVSDLPCRQRRSWEGSPGPEILVQMGASVFDVLLAILGFRWYPRSQNERLVVACDSCRPPDLPFGGRARCSYHEADEESRTAEGRLSNLRLISGLIFTPYTGWHAFGCESSYAFSCFHRIFRAVS